VTQPIRAGEPDPEPARDGAPEVPDSTKSPFSAERLEAQPAAPIQSGQTGSSSDLQANLEMSRIDMKTYEVSADAVAEAMLARGFQQLLVPEALDDGPASPAPTASVRSLPDLHWNP
jgi:hypothetical protein